MIRLVVTRLLLIQLLTTKMKDITEQYLLSVRQTLSKSMQGCPSFMTMLQILSKLQLLLQMQVLGLPLEVRLVCLCSMISLCHVVAASSCCRRHHESCHPMQSM